MIKPTIEHVEDIKVLYVRKMGRYAVSGNAAWKDLLDFIDQKGLNRASLRYFGIAYDDPEKVPEQKLRYDACISAPAGVKEKESVHFQTIKGGKNAVFIHAGSFDHLSKTYDKIFNEWLPHSNETVDPSRGIVQEYSHLEAGDPDKLITKILIPIL